MRHNNDGYWQLGKQLHAVGSMDSGEGGTIRTHPMVCGLHYSMWRHYAVCYMVRTIVLIVALKHQSKWMLTHQVMDF